MRKVFRQAFSTFLRRRNAKRHFERWPLPGTAALVAPVPGGAADFGAGGAGGAAGAKAPVRKAVQDLGRDLLATAAVEPAAALALLESHADGLDPTEAARRLVRDGPNDIQHEQPLPAWLHLWRCYLNPFNVLLTALAICRS